MAVFVRSYIPKMLACAENKAGNINLPGKVLLTLQ